MGDKTIVEYELPLLRSGDRVVLVDAVRYGENDFSANGAMKSRVTMEAVTWFMRSENYRPMSGRLYLAAARSEKLDDLTRKSGEAQTHIKAEMSFRMRLIAWLFYKITKRPFSWSHMFLRQPVFKADVQGGAAIDSLLLSEDPGTHVNGEFAFYFYSAPKTCGGGTV